MEPKWKICYNQLQGTLIFNATNREMEMLTIRISLSDHSQLDTFYNNKILSAVCYKNGIRDAAVAPRILSGTTLGVERGWKYPQC